MSKAHSPELKIFMDKKLLKLNGGRYVQGILWGPDPFMNLVIGERVEMATGGQQNNTGLVAIRGDIIPSVLEPVPTMAVHQRFNGVHMPPSPAFYYKNWVVYILLLNIFVKLL